MLEILKLLADACEAPQKSSRRRELLAEAREQIAEHEQLIADQTSSAGAE